MRVPQDCAELGPLCSPFMAGDKIILFKNVQIFFSQSETHLCLDQRSPQQLCVSGHAASPALSLSLLPCNTEPPPYLPRCLRRTARLPSIFVNMLLHQPHKLRVPTGFGPGLARQENLCRWPPFSKERSPVCWAQTGSQACPTPTRAHQLGGNPTAALKKGYRPGARQGSGRCD